MVLKCQTFWSSSNVLPERISAVAEHIFLFRLFGKYKGWALWHLEMTRAITGLPRNFIDKFQGWFKDISRTSYEKLASDVQHWVQNSRISRIIFKIQGLFKDSPKFSLKFKDVSRISRINMKFKDFKGLFKDVATLGKWPNKNKWLGPFWWCKIGLGTIRLQVTMQCIEHISCIMRKLAACNDHCRCNTENKDRTLLDQCKARPFIYWILFLQYPNPLSC